MKVVFVESSQLNVVQRQRVARTISDNNILATLCRVRKDVREIVEDALAELDHVVTTAAARVEVRDDILSEVCSKHKRIGVAVTDEQVVASRARQRIGAARTQDGIA